MQKLTKINSEIKFKTHIIEIQLQSQAWNQKLCDYENLITDIINVTLNSARPGLPVAEVSVVLAGSSLVHQLNSSYRGKDKPTNVLSFPACVPQYLFEETGQPYLLGDIILAFEIVFEEAKAQRKTLWDHTAHLLVHGTLHLLGYDHKNEEEAEKMESLEKNILVRVGIANPYKDRIEGEEKN